MVFRAWVSEVVTLLTEALLACILATESNSTALGDVKAAISIDVKQPNSLMKGIVQRKVTMLENRL